MPPRSKPSDFWNKVDMEGEGCWEWKAGYRSGYGNFRWEDRTMYAHIVAYKLSYGDIPKGLLVMHTCHNKKCCNPRHLKLGTHKDNKRDTDFAKYSQEQIDYVRDQYAKKIKNQTELAKELGTSPAYISQVISHKIWA